MPSKFAKAFLAKHKPDGCYREFTAKDSKRLGDRLPEVMREILERDGWASYDGQVLWLCDPGDWEEIGRPWLPEEAGVCDVLVRSSFGEMVAWDGDRFWLVLPHSSSRIGQTSSPDWLFGSTFQARDFLFNTEIRAETKAARKACGPLEWDQVYAHHPDGKAKDTEITREDAGKALAALLDRAPITSFNS